MMKVSKGSVLLKQLNCQIINILDTPLQKKRKNTLVSILNAISNLTARGDATFKRDFLDPLDKDFPKGAWSIHTDSSKTQVL